MIAVSKKFKEISLSVRFRHYFKFQKLQISNRRSAPRSPGLFVFINDISSHLRFMITSSLFLNNFSYEPVANHSVTFSVGKFIWGYRAKVNFKIAEIALKWRQKGMDAKVTDNRVKVTRFNSISFLLFELLHRIVTFPYNWLLYYLRFYAISCNNIHVFHHVQGALDTPGNMWFSGTR